MPQTAQKQAKEGQKVPVDIEIIHTGPADVQHIARAVQVQAGKLIEWQVQKQHQKSIMNIVLYLQELRTSKAIFPYRSKMMQIHT